MRKRSFAKRRAGVFIAAITAALPLGSRALGVSYTITNLNTGFTLGTGLTAVGLNDSDQVVGYYYNPAAGFREVPFIYTPTAATKYVGLTSFSGNASATAINNAGVVVGNDLATGDGFTYSSGTVSEIAPLAGSSLTFSGINNNNVAVGTSSTATSGVTRAVTYNISSHSLADVGSGFSGAASAGNSNSGYSINDSGQVAGLGVATGGTSAQPFVATPSGSSFTYNNIGNQFSNSGFAAPVAIDSLGDVAGSYVVPGDNMYVDTPFVFNTSSSTLTKIGGPPGNAYGVATVNGSDEVVGYNTLHDPYIDPFPFAYQNGTLTNLHNYDPTGVVLNDALAVNQNGDILCQGNTSTGATDYFLLTVNHITLTWTGAVSGNWDTTSNNFSPSLYSDGLPVVFDDTATGTTNINIASTVAPASVTFNNSSKNYVISGAGIGGGAATTLSVTGHGTVTLEGSNTYGGATNVSSGTLILGSSGSIASTTINVSAGGTLRIENGGILTAAATYANLALTVNGTFEMDNSASGDPNAILLSKLYIGGSTNNWTGKLDLANNALIGNYGSTGQINLAQVTNQVKSGYAGGTWTGNGITSSWAASDTTHLTALGVILNSEDGTTYGSAIYSTFDNQTVYASDILVGLTYYGDANLDGQVDGSDYTLIDNGFNNHLTGWYNGDFNYDGVVDGSDYTLIDNSYNTQGGNLGGGFNSGGGGFFIASSTEQIAGETSAVPEPSALTLIGAAALGMLHRRRKSAAVRDDSDFSFVPKPLE